MAWVKVVLRVDVEAEPAAPVADDEDDPPSVPEDACDMTVLLNLPVMLSRVNLAEKAMSGMPALFVETDSMRIK